VGFGGPVDMGDDEDDRGNEEFRQGEHAKCHVRIIKTSDMNS
jgi:hypothetical protein